MCSGADLARRMISVGFPGQMVEEGQHVCYIYNDDAERRRVVAKYIESGLLANEKVLYIADKATPEEILQSFAELDVDVQAKTAGLTLSGAPSIYYPKGTFSTEEMLNMTRAFYRQAVENEGFDGARGIGEMTWCLVKGRVDEATLMEYEARLTLLLGVLPYTACCQYDARRFDGALLLDVMSIHPVMIVHGQLVRNPFYLEPQSFLDAYHARGGRQTL